MKYAIVYSSNTGNTELLASTIRDFLPQDQVIYYGKPSPEALSADRIYVGFWTDKGSCPQEISDFLKTVTGGEVFLFGTAGFGGDPSYFAQILRQVASSLPREVKVVSSFMCQGKMPMSVRRRYEDMMNSPVHVPNLAEKIRNFDEALSHPSQEDLTDLIDRIRNI